MLGQRLPLAVAVLFLVGMATAQFEEDLPWEAYEDRRMTAAGAGAAYTTPTGKECYGRGEHANIHNGFDMILFKSQIVNRMPPTAGEPSVIAFKLTYYDTDAEVWKPISSSHLKTVHRRLLHIFCVHDYKNLIGHVHPEDFAHSGNGGDDLDEEVTNGIFEVTVTMPLAGDYTFGVDFVVDAGALDVCVDERTPHHHAADGEADGTTWVEVHSELKLTVEGDAYTTPERFDSKTWAGVRAEPFVGVDRVPAFVDTATNEQQCCTSGRADCLIAVLTVFAVHPAADPGRVHAEKVLPDEYGHLKLQPGTCHHLTVSFVNGTSGKEVDLQLYLNAAAHIFVVKDAEIGHIHAQFDATVPQLGVWGAHQCMQAMKSPPTPSGASVTAVTRFAQGQYRLFVTASSSLGMLASEFDVYSGHSSAPDNVEARMSCGLPAWQGIDDKVAQYGPTEGGAMGFMLPPVPSFDWMVDDWDLHTSGIMKWWQGDQLQAQQEEPGYHAAAHTSSPQIFECLDPSQSSDRLDFDRSVCVATRATTLLGLTDPVRPMLCLGHAMVVSTRLDDCSLLAAGMGVRSWGALTITHQRAVAMAAKDGGIWAGLRVDRDALLSDALQRCIPVVCGDACTQQTLVEYRTSLPADQAYKLWGVCHLFASATTSGLRACIEGIGYAIAHTGADKDEGLQECAHMSMDPFAMGGQQHMYRAALYDICSGGYIMAEVAIAIPHTWLPPAKEDIAASLDQISFLEELCLYPDAATTQRCAAIAGSRLAFVTGFDKAWASAICQASNWAYPAVYQFTHHCSVGVAAAFTALDTERAHAADGACSHPVCLENAPGDDGMSDLCRHVSFEHPEHHHGSGSSSGSAAASGSGMGSDPYTDSYTDPEEGHNGTHVDPSDDVIELPGQDDDNFIHISILALVAGGAGVVCIIGLACLAWRSSNVRVAVWRAGNKGFVPVQFSESDGPDWGDDVDVEMEHLFSDSGGETDTVGIRQTSEVTAPVEDDTPVSMPRRKRTGSRDSAKHPGVVAKKFTIRRSSDASPAALIARMTASKTSSTQPASEANGDDSMLELVPVAGRPRIDSDDPFAVLVSSAPLSSPTDDPGAAPVDDDIFKMFD